MSLSSARVLLACVLLSLGCARPPSSSGKAAVEAVRDDAHVIPARLEEPYRLGHRAEHLAFVEEQLPEALALYQRAWEGGVRHLPRWLFSAARAAARADRLEESLEWMKRALAGRRSTRAAMEPR